MSQSYPYEEGTSEELVPYLAKHPKQRFRLIQLPSEEKGVKPKGQMIQEGMFPELKNLPEEAFEDAEWHNQDARL